MDSRPDTWAHIHEVRARLLQVVGCLLDRAHVHDQSKLVEPELACFDLFTPKLETLEYGSDEYKECLEGMQVGLDHHYANNDHHPEHFRLGIAEMNLLQMMEMLADWKAATLRHKDGDLAKSIEFNQGRFGYSDEVKHLLFRTANDLGWLLP
jgi:hypothetical protein